MNNLGDIFREFCKFVDEHIFPEENAGTYVALIVDQAMIDEFCKSQSINEKTLLDAVGACLYDQRRDSLFVKGMIAIQLYAASKMANGDGITATNYRNRLSELLDWDISQMDEWLAMYQDGLWYSLYDWCDYHFFQITKCEKRSGPWNRVQYPINQAKRVFNTEDLKYIAACFVKKGLSPNEDLQKRDFKKIISHLDIQYSAQSNHGKVVIDNSVREEDYYNQVFNYFLRWNGDYKEKSGRARSVIKKDAEQLYMYLPDDFSCLELRTAKLSLEKRFDISNSSYESIAKSYNFKRNGVILFKHDDVYDNYWQEVRYLEGKDEEGLIVCYYQKESDVHDRLRPYIVSHNEYVQIFKIKYDYDTRDFYTDKRFYELYGGLKIGRQIYLYGAAPVLKLEWPTRIWIDGKAYGDGDCEGEVTLSHLPEGYHYIKIQDYKKIEFELVNAKANSMVWMNDYNQWHFNRKSLLWENTREDGGIVGLDYSSISHGGQKDNVPILQRWAELLSTGHLYENETNITLQIIKQQSYDRV